MKPQERFTVGEQPCANFLRGDADIAALGEGNRRNLHQCPKCEGNRAWCDNCHTDHHDGGWGTCKPPDRRETETEIVALWMGERGYATGHGDTIEDMLGELEAQARVRQPGA